MHRSIQDDSLATAGATKAQIAELRRYDAHSYKEQVAAVESLPLADEPFVECWARWLDEARDAGVFPTLERHLPQLRFPVREGMRQSDAYRAATLRGVTPAVLPEATGLALERPGDLELELYPSLAGRIPVIIARWRPDFVLLVQALAHRNEPAPVPEAQGAVMVSGYNNWQRIRRLENVHESPKELYQDRFIVLSDGPYGAVPAADLGLDDETWRARSLVIRREHECTHYLTRRAFGEMRNHVLDEILADYMGLVAACGRFRADWFLRCLGLDGEGCRPDARLRIYRGQLSDGAFEVVQRLLRRAAANVERFDACCPPGPRSPDSRGRALLALSSLSFLELTSPAAPGRLNDRLKSAVSLPTLGLPPPTPPVPGSGERCGPRARPRR